MNDDEQQQHVSDDSAVQQQQQDSGQQQQPDEGQQQQQAPQQPAGLDFDKLRQSIVEGVRMASPQQQQPQQQQRQMSKEEFDRMMNAVKVDGGMLKALYGFDEVSPEQVEAHQRFVDAVVRHAVTMADWRVQAAQKQWQDQFTPVQRQLQQQAENQYRQEFVTAYPHLKPYSKLLEVVYQQVAEDMQQGRIPSVQGKDAVFALVATRAQEMLKNLGLNVQPTQQGNQQRSQMSAVAAGGQGGGSGGGGTNTQGGVPAELRGLFE